MRGKLVKCIDYTQTGSLYLDSFLVDRVINAVNDAPLNFISFRIIKQ